MENSRFKFKWKSILRHIPEKGSSFKSHLQDIDDYETNFLKFLLQTS